MEKIKTSASENKSPEIFRGVSHFTARVSVSMAFFGGLLALMFQGSPLIQLLVFVAVPTISFMAAQKAIGGNFEFEGLENFYGRFMGFFKKGDVVNLEKEGVSVKREENGRSRLFGRNLSEIECYKIEKIDEKLFLSDMRYLLKNLPEGSSLQFVRIAEPLKSPKASLKKAKLFKNYIFVEYKHSAITPKKFKADVAKTLGAPKNRVSDKDTLEVIRKIVEGDGRAFDFEEKKPLRDVGIYTERALLHFGELEKRGVCLSLAALSENVSVNLQKLYGVLNSQTGTLSVKFKSLGGKNIIDEILKERRFQKLKKERVDPGEASRVNLSMHIHALIHAKEEGIEELFDDLSREHSHLPFDERPYFSRENHYLKQALINIIPGSDLPFTNRAKNIISLEEAVHYLPLPQDGGKDRPFLTLRTEFNSIYNFSLDYAYPLYIWASPGMGKSALLSLIMLTHVKKPKTASFAMEAGGTFSFLRDGVADVNIILEQDHNGEWRALEDHPLRAFFAYGTSGIEAATGWLMVIADIEDEADEIKTALRSALIALKDEGGYRLRDLCQKLDKEFESQAISSRVAKLARKNISNFSSEPQNQYGKIFDPDNTKSIDYDGARHFYVCQTEVSKDAPKLLRAFFGYGTYLLKAIEKRFATGGSDPCDLLVSLDEINHLVKEHYIGWQDLRDLNSQGRKQGKLTCCASQSLTDTIQAESERPYDIIESFSHFLFASGVSDINHLIRALKISDPDRENQVRKDFQKALDAIDTLRRRGKGYAWGYIDTSGQIKIVMIDLEKADQWAVTSHKAARLLREEVICTLKSSYWRACELLSLYGPGDLPIDDPPSQELKNLMYEKMWRHKSETKA